VQLSHASGDSRYCDSVNGVYSKSGNWSVHYTSTSSFQVSWGVEACWPKSVVTSGNSLDVLNYASVSAYELEITVVGPRGVSPWAGGNQTTAPSFKQVQPKQLLQQH
jgi:hypothetical protein